MRYIILFGALFLLIDAHAQGTQACFVDESQQPANGARVEVFEDNVLIGAQDLVSSNCTDLGIIIATESQDVPSRDFSVKTYPTVGSSRFTSNVSVGETTEGKLSVYSIEGRRITSTERRLYPPGQHRFEVELGNVSSGSYFVVFESERGPITSQVFIVRRSAGGNAIREIGTFQSSIREERMDARKMDGFEYKLRITRYGSRQTIVSLNRGENKTVVLDPGHTVLMHVREMTNHYQSLIGGEVIITEGRSGLEQRIQITGDVTSMYVPSDSVLWQYFDPDHQKGRFSIQPIAPVGSPLKKGIDVYTHPAAFVTPLYTEETPKAPWWMSPERYAKNESVATLFAMPDSFDIERYWDEIRSSFYTPPESKGNPSLAWMYPEYKGTLSEAELREGVRELPFRFTGGAEGGTEAIGDSVRAAMISMVPTSYENTFLAVQPVEEYRGDNYTVEIRTGNPPYPLGAYWTLFIFVDSVLKNPTVTISDGHVYAPHDIALLFTSLESLLDDSNPPFEFIETDTVGNHINEFTQAFKEYKAVQYGLGRMIASGTPAEPIYYPGTYEVWPDEIRGGFMSFFGTRYVGKWAGGPYKSTSQMLMDNIGVDEGAGERAN